MIKLLEYKIVPSFKTLNVTLTGEAVSYVKVTVLQKKAQLGFAYENLN